VAQKFLHGAVVIRVGDNAVEVDIVRRFWDIAGRRSDFMRCQAAGDIVIAIMAIDWRQRVGVFVSNKAILRQRPATNLLILRLKQLTGSFPRAAAQSARYHPANLSG
jgi:hypothetical protein